MMDVKFKLAPGHASNSDWMAPSRLRHLFWNVTHECNFACGVCFSSSGRRTPDELTTAEATETLRRARDAGVDTVVLSGGEPFLRPDLFEILTCMARLGITTRIASNGSCLTDDTLRRMAVEKLATSFQISVDTLDPDTYERVHGAPAQMLNRALDALRLIRSHGFHTTVSARLTPETLAGLPALLDRAAEEGWATVTVHCPLHSGRARGAWPLETDLLALLEPACEHFVRMSRHWVIETNIPWARYHPAIRALEGRIRLAHDGCGAGRWRLAIQPNGDITPCLCVHAPGWILGNVRRDDLGHVFRHSPHARALRSPWDHGLCADCPEVRRCGAGCRALAYARTGRFDGPDEACPLRRGPAVHPLSPMPLRQCAPAPPERRDPV